MSERLLGLETEHGFSVPAGRPRDRCVALEGLMTRARSTIPHLPGVHGSGLFTDNGSRFYIDCGSHPEFCTPEVDNPWDLVRYISAGDLLLQRLAEETSRLDGLPPIWIYKCHVDYGDRSTWGCHENYGHKARPGSLPRQLIPHLVTRLIYTGAGGLNPFATGIEFCLSPRVHHLDGDVTDSSTGTRPIFHTKDESLSGHGWSRLHVICGESVLSHRAMFLRAATTGLIVALTEAGLKPAAGVKLAAPLEAMRRFNADPTGRATAPLATGQEATALQVQRHYLSFAEAHLDHAALPCWAGDACRLWRETLDLIERGPAAVSRSLDWGIKRALYQAHLERRGITPAQQQCWNTVLGLFTSPWDQEQQRPQPLTAEFILSPRNLSGPLVHALEPRLREHGLSWDDVPGFLQCRAELCELEIRFSRLGPEGLFNVLDRAGHLGHALPEVTPASIEQAMHTPPSRGRAGVRGRLIRDYAGRDHYGADWDAIWDMSGRRIDLSDPFVNQPPGWAPDPRQNSPIQEDIFLVPLEDASRAYDRGEYDQALALVGPLRRWRGHLRRQPFARAVQLESWVQARRGFPEQSQAVAAEYSRLGMPELEGFSYHVCVHRFAGLAPSVSAMAPWVERAEADLERIQHAPSPAHFAYLGHKAALRRQEGRLAEAREILERARAMALGINPQSRVLARNLCDLAEVHRRLGETALAARCLHEARAIQQNNRYDGDYAEFNLVVRAKLLAHARSEARALLHEARLLQRRLGHRFGMARTMFLQARLFPSLWHNQRRKRLLLAFQREIPALRDCPLAGRILAHWEQWVGGHCEAGEDFFWGM